ncbi:MAG: hypothetical protein P4L79_14595 [Legionella sp.]|uniref:hypothetical protein n=1 Tax=Legionella sp. TaxID=459 RepID=UPI0028402A2A|nr:hypothetical protein [Legionella sp.]
MPRYNGHYHHHHHGHRSHQADTGVFLMFAGLLLGSPFLLILGYLEYMTAPMLVAASSTTFLGLSTLSLSALIVYGSVGVAYMFSGAKECYSSDHGPLDLLKSRVTNNGLVSTLGAILWSPFLLVGGVAGATAKAVVNTFSSKPSSKANGSSSNTTSLDEEESEEESDLLSSSHSNHSAHSQHEHSKHSGHSSDEEDNFESPLSASQKEEADTPLQSSTESVTHSDESVRPSTSFRLPISKSQDNLTSYSKMVSGLDVKPLPLDDSRIDHVPVTAVNLLRQHRQDVPAQDLVQQQEGLGLK